MKRLGVIGGTALEAISEQHSTSKDEILLETPYGEVPVSCLEFENGKKIIFLQRHHGKAMMPPHEINHQANIFALYEARVEAILSVCSVGAIAEDFQPGQIDFANQYIDFSGIATSFHYNEAIFTSMTSPFDSKMNQIIKENIVSSVGRTYWLAQGPQYETPAEINAIEILGGEAVGMTMPREVKLAAELQIPYSALLVSSNWAAGRDPGNPQAKLVHEEVSSQANKQHEQIYDCINAIMQNNH